MARKDAYMEALKEALTDETPAAPTSRTRQEIAADINEITKLLTGPLSNVERLCLVEDRQRLRLLVLVLHVQVDDVVPVPPVHGEHHDNEEVRGENQRFCGGHSVCRAAKM